MTTTVTSAPARRWATTLVVVVAATPALLGLALIGAITTGAVGLLAPVAWGAFAYLYRMVVVSTWSTEGRVVSREVGAALLGAALGFGGYVAMLFVGVWFDLIPFIGRSQAYPYEDAWHLGSVLVAVATTGVTWWVLRRWADSETPQ